MIFPLVHRYVSAKSKKKIHRHPSELPALFLQLPHFFFSLNSLFFFLTSGNWTEKEKVFQLHDELFNQVFILWSVKRKKEKKITTVTQKKGKRILKAPPELFYARSVSSSSIDNCSLSFIDSRGLANLRWFLDWISGGAIVNHHTRSHTWEFRIKSSPAKVIVRNCRYKNVKKYKKIDNNDKPTLFKFSLLASAWVTSACNIRSTEFSLGTPSNWLASLSCGGEGGGGSCSSVPLPANLVFWNNRHTDIVTQLSIVCILYGVEPLFYAVPKNCSRFLYYKWKKKKIFDNDICVALLFHL